jgi:hypothetical protein
MVFVVVHVVIFWDRMSSILIVGSVGGDLDPVGQGQVVEYLLATTPSGFILIDVLDNDTVYKIYL